MNKLIRSEWVKVSSIRTPWILLGVGLALATLTFVLQVSTFDRETLGVGASTDIASRISVISSTSALWGPFLGIVGILSLGTEFRHKTIATTVVAAPIRREVLASKIVVSALMGLVAAIAYTVVFSVVGVLWLGAKGYPLGFDDLEFARTLIGMIAYGGIVAALGVGVGALFRSAALGIVNLLVWMFVVEGALGAVLPESIERLLPFSASAAMTSPDPTGISPYEGAALFAAWAIVVLLVGWFLFERRDLA